MIRRAKQLLRGLWAGATRTVTTPPFVALAPFRSSPAPLSIMTRKTSFFAICVFLGVFYGFWGSVLPPGFIIFLIVPFLLLGAILLWIWPDSTEAPGNSLAIFIFVFTGVTFLWPNYLAIVIPGLPWLSLRRVVGIAMVLVFLFTLASSSLMRKSIVDRLKVTPLLAKFLIGFFVVQAIAIITSNYPVLAYKHWFNTQYAWTLVFFASVYIFYARGNFTKWVDIICYCALIVSIIAIFEQHNKMVLWANHIPSFLKIEGEVVERILSPTYRGSQYRSQAIFGVSLALAEFLALSFTLLLHRFMTAETVGRKFLLMMAMIAALTAIGMSRARLGFVGVIVGLALYGFIWGYRNYKRDKTDIIGATLTYGYPAIMMAAAVLIVSVDALRIRILGGGQAQLSNDGREIQFDMAPPVIMNRPIFGYGGAQGAEALGYRSANGLLTIDTYLLSIVLDYGIVGFVFFYGAIAMAAFYALRWALAHAEFKATSLESSEVNYLFPLGVMLVQFYVIKTVLSQEENHSILFLMLGAVIALLARYRDKPQQKGLTFQELSK